MIYQTNHLKLPILSFLGAFYGLGGMKIRNEPKLNGLVASKLWRRRIQNKPKIDGLVAS